MSKWKDKAFVSAYNKAYRERNLERLREYGRKYAADHSAEAVARARKAYAKKQAERDVRRVEREAAKIERRRGRLAKARENVKRWRARNPERCNENARNGCQRRRANFRGVGLPRGVWAAIKGEYGHRCAYCGRGDLRLEQEHVEPLSRGGFHDSTNVVPACHHCNRSKGSKTPLLWLAR
jgi:5-methylcytosine-specific restriction endonuclease McrA